MGYDYILPGGRTVKIALMNEVSQASKNSIILEQLQSVATKYNHEVYNVGMRYEEQKPIVSYIHLGLMACILLNSKSVDFVVTGCGTGQAANISLNNYPGVVCGLIVEPTDGFLFAQINNGNAIALPYAKGFGWGSELNINNIFERTFSCERGNGYPPDRREVQNTFKIKLDNTKATVNKDVMTILRSVDQDFLKECCASQSFQDCLFANSQDAKITDYIKKLLQ
jgi:ribose 5-phosphate isomerase B